MPSDSEPDSDEGPTPLPAGLPPHEQAQQLLEWVEVGNRYARTRKRRFGRRASAVRVTALALSAASTIILGLQSLDFWTGLGFSFIALSTTLGAIEPYFAWRNRWILMEDIQYKFYRISDDIRFLIASNPPDNIPLGEIRALYVQYKEAWEVLSNEWIGHRRYAGSGT